MLSEKQIKEVIKLRNKDLGYKTIADKLSIKRGQVRHICLKNNLGGMRAGQNQFGAFKERERKFKKDFENKFPGFEYVSDFKNVDSKFKMKCKECNSIQERNANLVRPSREKELQCDNCNRIKLEKKKEKELFKKETELKERIIKLIKDRKENLERELLLNKVCQRCGQSYRAESVNSVHCEDCVRDIKRKRKARRAKWEGKLIKCKECGKEFKMRTIRSKHCSTDCKKKYENRRKEIRKRKLKENGKVNYNITLNKLIKRDKRICQLCGKEINDNDFKRNEEGHFIVGNNYPSIDHVVPVSKGGTHTWDNVQLAHMYCNSIKNNKI